MPLLTTTPAELGLTDAEWEEMVAEQKKQFLDHKVSTMVSLYNVFGLDTEQDAEETFWFNFNKGDLNSRNVTLAWMVARNELNLHVAKCPESGYSRWLPKESK